MSAELEMQNPGRLVRTRALRHSGLWIGGALTATVLGLALFSPLIATHDPYVQDLSIRLTPPIWHEGGSWDHVLGTDRFGRDYFSRVVYGARVAVIIGLSVMALSGFIGTALGVMAGYFGGKVDAVVIYIVTTRLSMPVVLAALAVVSIVGSSLHVIIAVLGLLLWDRFAVVTRTVTQRITSQEYIVAARAVGCSNARIIVQEVLPNLFNTIVVIGTVEMAQAILLAAALSFLGLGVQPPTPSWGLMIADGKEFILFDSWLITIPGIALFGFVLGINLVGDGIRDVTTAEGRN